MSETVSVAAEQLPDLTDDSALRVLARRLLSVPLYAALAAATLVLAPVWLPLALLADALRRPPRTTVRCGLFFTYYLLCETAGILASFGLWLGSGPWTGSNGSNRDRWLERNFRLQCWWAGALFRGASRIFGFRLEVEGDDAVARGPLLLLPRHASVADTLLASHLVSRRHGIRMRYVLKRELLWDPCLDIVGNRLPNCFVRRGSDDRQREIERVASLAGALGEDGILIYPEGTRFTPAKRERALERLRRSADPDFARRAERLQRVLPPRLGGILALLERCPGTDVVFCAHRGFEATGSFWDVWRGALVDSVVRVACWRVPAARIPRERRARIEWLCDEWERVDAWIAAAEVLGTRCPQPPTAPGTLRGSPPRLRYALSSAGLVRTPPARSDPVRRRMRPRSRAAALGRGGSRWRSSRRSIRPPARGAGSGSPVPSRGSLSGTWR